MAVDVRETLSRLQSPTIYLSSGELDFNGGALLWLVSWWNELGQYDCAQRRMGGDVFCVPQRVLREL